ncbi:DinB family protein [Paenibacillus sp. NPDC056579]|uniref:DinB family protein n=1 Tax=Paenibacillus sp. NPDC056579 TaxID=3345871 RepID=UPI00367A3C18
MNAAVEFYEFHIWSYKTLLEHLEKLPEAVLSAEFAEGFRSIGDVLLHVYNGEHFWRSVLSAKFPYSSLDGNMSIYEWKVLYASLHQTTREIVLDSSDPAQPIQFSSRKGREMSNTIQEIVLTVVNHGTYHRGNIATMLRQLGHKSVSSDYAFYLNDLRSN